MTAGKFFKKFGKLKEMEKKLYKTINLKYLLQRGMINWNYMTDVV